MLVMIIMNNFFITQLDYQIDVGIFQMTIYLSVLPLFHTHIRVEIIVPFESFFAHVAYSRGRHAD